MSCWAFLLYQKFAAGLGYPEPYDLSDLKTAAAEIGRIFGRVYRAAAAGKNRLPMSS
jgi:hypothetical protein